MPPTSGELWGHQFMPLKVELTVLLPNGMVLLVEASRDQELKDVKRLTQIQAERESSYEPLDFDNFVFKGVRNDGEFEEFYDESRLLCDLRLFLPILSLQEPQVRPVGRNRISFLFFLLKTTPSRSIERLIRKGIVTNEEDENKDESEQYPIPPTIQLRCETRYFRFEDTSLLPLRKKLDLHKNWNNATLVIYQDSFDLASWRNDILVRHKWSRSNSSPPPPPPPSPSSFSPSILLLREIVQRTSFELKSGYASTFRSLTWLRWRIQRRTCSGNKFYSRQHSTASTD